MRAVVQRVREARVQVGGREIAAMGRGLLALVAVAREDDEADALWLARKLVGLRVFPDAHGRMQHALRDVAGTLGVVSQFTLLADVRKGRRPSFGAAAPGPHARRLVERVVQEATASGVTTVTGRFGEEMEVALVNMGPVTLWIDTREAR